MNDDEKRAIFQELLEVVRSPTREDYPQPNITVGEYASLEGLTKSIAYNALERKVLDGTLKKVRIQVGDQACNIYWKT